jgi:D-alanine-D-alanine ligase
MRIGLTFDLKSSFREAVSVEDALEEYDSLETIEAIEQALVSCGHNVVRLGGGREFLDKVRTENIDIVFNISEGAGNYRSREAQVPSVLEMLGVPYTGSDPLCLAVCLDKPVAKKIVMTEGVRTPAWLIVKNEKELIEEGLSRLSFPVMIKPAYEGSSKGIRQTSLAQDREEAENEALRIIRDYQQSAMIEEFIDGDEITVGIIGNSPPRVLGIMRIIPKAPTERFIYSLEVKRDYLNLVEYEIPAHLPENILEEITKASLASFRALGCRDFARVDFRLDRNGRPYFIEINPLPGLGSYSDLIIMAGQMGITQENVIISVLDTALERNLQWTYA